MGSVLAEGIISAGLCAPARVYVSDIRKEKLARLKRLGARPAGNRELARDADVIIIAVKPDRVRETLDEIKNLLVPSKILISIAAGISTADIEKHLHGKKIPVIRVMPNVNVKVKAGLLPYCAGKYAGSRGKVAERLLSPLGIVFRLPENRFDSITAISGSGPGFLFYVAENVRKICRMKGFSEKEALLISAHLFYGTGKMLARTGLSPEKLREMVTSPGGTTFAGLSVFEQKGFPGILKKVIDKAEKRSRELSSGK